MVRVYERYFWRNLGSASGKILCLEGHLVQKKYGLDAISVPNDGIWFSDFAVYCGDTRLQGVSLAERDHKMIHPVEESRLHT